LPLKFDARIWTERDLELPGFPIIIIGILFMMHTNAVKTFYLSALFKATPRGSLSFPINLFCSYFKIFSIGSFLHFI